MNFFARLASLQNTWSRRLRLLRKHCSILIEWWPAIYRASKLYAESPESKRLWQRVFPPKTRFELYYSTGRERWVMSEMALTPSRAFEEVQKLQRAEIAEQGPLVEGQMLHIKRDSVAPEGLPLYGEWKLNEEETQKLREQLVSEINAKSPERRIDLRGHYHLGAHQKCHRGDCHL